MIPFSRRYFEKRGNMYLDFKVTSQEKHVLIDSELVFFSHTWLTSYLFVFSWVTVTIDSLPTMQQCTYLRMKLASERSSFAKLKRTNTWHKLVRGFNPSEKYESNWIISPNRDEHKKKLKPPPRGYLFTTYLPESSKIFWNLSSKKLPC